MPNPDRSSRPPPEGQAPGEPLRGGREAARGRAAEGSGERFRLLFENSLDAVLETAPDGSVHAANPAACALFGRTEDEIRRSGRDGLVDPADSRLRDLLERRARDGRARGEIRFVRRDGGRFEAEVSTALFLNPEGQVRSSMIIRDLSPRREAEMALRENEANLRAILEATGESVLLVEVDGTIRAANATACERLGCAPGAVTGRNLFSFFPPETAAARRERMEEVVRSGGTVRFVDRRGERLLEHTLYPIRDDGERVRRIAIYSRDITEQRQREDLERVQHTLALRLASTGDLDDGLRACIDAALQATGMDAGGIYLVDEATGALRLALNRGLSAALTATAAQYSAESEHAREIMAGRSIHARRGGVAWRLPESASGDGVRCLSIVPFRDRERVIGCLIAVSHTIGEAPEAVRLALETIAASAGQAVARLRAEAGRSESEDRFRRAVESAPDAIFIQTRGRFAYLNRAAARLFGAADAGDLVGRSVVEHFAPENRDVVEDRIRRLNEGRERVPLIEEEILHPDGTRVPVEVSAVPFTHDGNHGALVFARDITARTRAEADLRESEQRLRLAAEAAKMGTWERDLATGRLIWSTLQEALMGYEPGTFPGTEEAFVSLIHPASRADYEKARERVRAGDGSYETELRFVLRDGRERWGLLRGRAVSDASGRRVRIVGVDLDITDRRIAEAARRASERRLKAIFESSPVAIATSRLADGRYLEVNGAFVRLFGYPRDEIVGRRADELGLWSASQRAEMWRSLEEGGRLANAPLRARTRSGAARDLLGSVEFIELDGERCVVEIFNDVTELRTAEAALRVSEANLREAQSVARIGSWTFDVASGRVEWSDELYRIFGLAPGTFGGTHAAFVERIHPEDRLRVLQTNELARTTGQSFDIEYRVILPEGTVTFVRELGHATLGECGSVVRLFGTAQDVTEIRKAERMLRLQGAALEAAANAIVITDRAGTIEWANPAFSTLSGWSLEEALGKNPRDLVKSGEHDADYYRRMWTTIQAGRVWRSEIVNRRKDGVLRTEEITITPLRGEGGVISHFIAIKQDITEQKALEERLRQAQRMEAIGTLAGGIAHDMNNILAPILMISGYLSDRLPEEDDRELLAMVQAGARRGAEIVRQLLAFSRQEAGERVLVQPRHLMKEVIGIMRETFPREIDLGQRFAADLWTVKADPTQLHQVLLNLCVNARDAMPEGGRLVLEASNLTLRADDPSLPPGAEPGPYVLLEVGDTGHGIPAEIRQRIFDPFFTTKPRGKGTGLGLSTVMGIVRGHGGFVEVDSEPGQGTTFRVYLPATPDGAQPEVAAPPVPEPRPQAATTVLVVDDERDVREATARVLERGGYRVLTASNGADALTVYLHHRPEVRLVLTDLMMPVMNGVALIRALRAIDPALKVVATTGLTDAAQEGELAGLGVAEVLPKPSDMETVLAALRRCLDAGGG